VCAGRGVQSALRAYFECGDYAHGFLRLDGGRCRRDILVPFSCKGRGLGPSCGARRMCNEAAAATDRVASNVPIRQRGLSLPFELRRLAAFDAKALTALGRFFVDAIFAEQKAAMGATRAECEAMTHVQRFGPPSAPGEHDARRASRARRRDPTIREVACVAASSGASTGP
jgi:hypothetical protein